MMDNNYMPSICNGFDRIGKMVVNVFSTRFSFNDFQICGRPRSTQAGSIFIAHGVH